MKNENENEIDTDAAAFGAGRAGGDHLTGTICGKNK